MVATSKAKTLAAQQEAIRAEEAGKAAAMEAKWEQEKIKAVEVTKAEQAYEVARLEALEAKEIAKKIREQAEAHAARLKVQAGLTPLERATIEKETAIGVAQALAESKVRWVPEVMVTGDDKGGSDPLRAVGLNMLLDIAKKQGK